ncbi:MAG TPA: hypothetical protein VJZ27_15185, partial [Aggregatilineales bacterium]|nr:hypothetical protein [Aggregatilineales bacterium]
ARGTAPAAYTYYLHVLDSEDNIVAQHDQQPLNGLFPTDFWQSGLRFSETLTLDIPPEAEKIRFGLYAPDFQRAIWTQNGEVIGDGISIALPGRSETACDLEK